MPLQCWCSRCQRLAQVCTISPFSCLLFLGARLIRLMLSVCKSSLVQTRPWWWWWSTCACACLHAGGSWVRVNAWECASIRPLGPAGTTKAAWKCLRGVGCPGQLVSAALFRPLSWPKCSLANVGMIAAGLLAAIATSVIVPATCYAISS